MIRSRILPSRTRSCSFTAIVCPHRWSTLSMIPNENSYHLDYYKTYGVSFLCGGELIEKSLGQLDVPGHSYPRVAPQRFTK
jgi:hypothetical protein